MTLDIIGRGRPRAAWRGAVLVATLVACQAPPPAEAPVVRPVRWATARVAGERTEHALAGAARAGTESRLSFRVGGSVRRVHVAVGQGVEKGEVLAELDPTDYAIQEQEARAALASANAEARSRKASYERVRDLYEGQNASRADLDTARAAFESAQANVAASGQRLELARRQLAFTRLVAPVAGSIASVSIEENENVTAGQMVVMLASGDRPEVEVGMPEGLIAHVTEGDDVSVRFGAIPERVFAGVITEVGVAASGSTFPVTVRLTDVDPRIRSGLAADVRFQVQNDPEHAAHLEVPPVAVGEDREGHYVFVLREAGGGLATAHRRRVRVGSLSGAGIEIEDGLEPGERIATAGVRRLVEGQEVRLLDEETTG